ncbi:hypothetical protein CO172_00980 [Candidatus Uhrbacteria bacterium CG_4_9_14_3_um_filter_36_7]|uniref:FAD/NAD(P)-binding domain-containing protein n=1 Tax=Candidatus Uhrbacteria bacterium CG_4_9_14_3_um_filter_36_7 TaxID=1975033 RepID=A0A2M7XI25_9BACT|nr:MAG: hypothetical protein CO172_00980 [Candidatus Uhrbacteria bacterium CG_4_9_14_3_um_filter_36_7]
MDQCKKTTYLIIGAGIAGTTAAESIRSYDPDKHITLVTAEPYRAYSRVLLSKPGFFLEKIPFDRVWLKSSKWYSEQKIEYLTNKKAISLDCKKHLVTFEDQTLIEYEKLLLATGGLPKKLEIPWSDKKNIYYLQTLDQAKEIIAATKTAKKAVVVGGGFIAFEMCSLFCEAGMHVDLITRRSHFWNSTLETEGSLIIEQAMKNHGVTIYHETEIESIIGNKQVEKIILTNKKEIPCDLLLVGIGMEFSLDWISKAGINTHGGIIANEFLQTNEPNIWTAGDIAEFSDTLTGESLQYGNWVNAMRQGCYAGACMAGQPMPAFSFISSYTSSGFGLTLGFAGCVKNGSNRIIKCQNQKNQKWSQFFYKNNRLVGALFINQPEELGKLIKKMKL